MSRVQKFSLFVIPLLLLSFSISASYAETYYYATTDMTFAEFYAGETKESSSDLYAQGLDAISTPTTHGLARFPLVLGVSGDTGTTISGLKAVQVRMSEDVYAALSNDSRFTFTASSFDEYKPVNSNGTFGAMVTETAAASDAVAVIASGSSARWGHYVISVKSADITIGSANRYCDYYLGALIETSDGKIYGLRHDNNIWSNTDIAFCVNENYTEPHGTGVKRYYEYTADLQGETITKLTYMLKGRPDVVINTSLYVKKQTSADVKAVSSDLKTGSSVQVKFTLTSADSYSFSGVALRSGRTSIPVTDCTYSDGVLTLTNPAAGTYTATFTSDEYVDISASFTLSDYYAVTDMTWAEFYAGEVAAKSSAELLAAGMDAVSSPTARVANRFTQLVSESNDIGGRDITGVKDVQVRMTGTVYEALTDKSRYTFSDDVFSEYKLVSADGSFGAMVTQTTTASSAEVTLSSGASATWGNYVLKISSADVTLGSGDTRYYLGALITTDDGSVYGMRHNNNLWFSASDMALAVQEFVEVHGVSRKYAYTSDMTGKTITKIQYMLKNLPDVVVNCNVFLLPLSLTASTDRTTVDLTAGIGASLDITTQTKEGEPIDCEIVSLIYGTGRGRKTISTEYYSYSDGVLTLSNGLSAGQYTAIFRNEKYADVSVSFTVTGVYHFATTNMTYKEFYLGEVGDSALSLDAVSSATTGKAARFGVLSYDVADNKTTIYGLADVQVRMADEVYALLSKDSRYTFSTTPFAEYKVVSTDKTFGKMVTDLEEVEGATVEISSGASTVWGNYWLKLSGVDSVDVSGKYLGAVLETSDGKLYPMQHLYNLFFKKDEMAFCVQDFTEPHGNTPAYEHTNDLVGKTITKITYLLKDTADMYVSCNVAVPLMSTATVSLSNNKVTSGTNIAIPLTFTGSPEGAEYSVTSLYSGSGRSRTPITSYTFSDNTLTISGDIAAGNYTAIFHTEGYTDIALTFYVEGYHFATTNMTWAEFYAGEIGTSSSDLWSAGLDAVSSSTKRIAGRFTQLVSADNDLGGADITGVKAVQVRMPEDVYQLLSSDSRYTFTTTVFSEYKDVDSAGSFGEMLTEYEDADGAIVALKSGQNSTWGNYMLNISSADIALTSGDERLDLGALITISEDGKTYGLRHNSNLWFSAGEIALTYEEFVEPHGISRDYDYTSDLQGKTVTKIQYMLKNKPDVVISCNVYLKLKSTASVSFDYPAGYNAVLSGTGDSVTITFENCSSDVLYDIASVTPSIRHASALDASLYSYSNGKLSFDASVGAGKYKAVFSTEKYSDIAATVEVFTTDATSLIVSDDNNAAGLSFLLTPKGYIDAVDEELSANKFVNASDYTTIASNKTASYSAGAHTVSGSGFSFDVVLNDVSDDYTGIVGFGKQFNMTRSALGSVYDSVYTAVNSIPVGASGFREIPQLSVLNSAGLKAVQVLPDGTSRDISALTGAGAMLNSDGSIFLFYGVMAADSRTITEGEYTLSPEGETLINDGAKDGHIRVAIYLEMPVASSSSSGGDSSTTTSTTSPDVRPASGDVRPPASGDVRPPESGDVRPPASGDVRPPASSDVNPPVSPESRDQPANPNPPAPVDSGDQPVNPNPSTPSTSGDTRPTTPDNPSEPDNPADPGGDNTGGNEPSSVVPTTPSVNVQDSAVAQKIADILNAIVSFITGDTEIAELPEESVGSQRTLADVSEEERAAIPEGETPAVILPIMRVEKAAVYVFGVDLSDLEVGARIFLRMMAESTTTNAAMFYSSAENTGDVYTFLDDDGNETEVVPANKHVNVAAYMEPEYTYAPMITTKTSSSGEDDSGSDNTGDNTGGDNSGDNSGGDNSGTETNTSTVGSSGGGCDSGFSFVVLAVLGLLAKKHIVK